MKITVEFLNEPNWNAIYKNLGQQIILNNQDIRNAYENGNNEPRSLQKDIKELMYEWDAKSNFIESYLSQKQYHINRIATIIRNNIWQEPILLYNDKRTLLDGGHRLLAVKYMKKTEIEAIILEESELSEDKRNELWKMIEVHKNIEDALDSLDIKYKR